LASFISNGESASSSSIIRCIIHNIIGIIHQIRASASNLSLIRRICHWHSFISNGASASSSSVIRRIIHHIIDIIDIIDIIHQIKASASNPSFIHRICHWHRSSAMVNPHEVAASFVLSFAISLASCIRSEHPHQISASSIASSIGIVHQQWCIGMR